MTARENAPTPFLLTINGEQIASNSSKISQLKDAKVISSSSDLIFYINTKGELIQLHDKLKSYPFQDKNVQVYFITSGNNHSIAFAKDGEKYTAFGIGNTDNFIKNDYKNKIIAEWETLPDEIVNKRLVNGSCGDNFTFYLTVDGRVYLFQEQKLDFVQSLYGIDVISLAAGNNHCVALSSTRNVYIHQGKKFEKIDKLVGIDKILSLGNFSAALDNEGIAYAWRCENECKIHKINVDQIKDIAFFNERYRVSKGVFSTNLNTANRNKQVTYI
ncbi:hypothetical protein TVAG_117280 [Trichomonas vaginalis G3]|uniref:Uncharacterized protein n=1 Tax=Trichomonas vaginalis (strain ATCC PRA-98 / G3) TaxID=412133 RepID=A2E3R8_TRIV3|nr:hypothetical protein TVAG_117280 [Trichomonas vaginalis G3]|eukprot:XP_001324929.1 hypothetical protein [Trichomonas vaginalis G3]